MNTSREQKRRFLSFLSLYLVLLLLVANSGTGKELFALHQNSYVTSDEPNRVQTIEAFQPSDFFYHETVAIPVETESSSKVTQQSLGQLDLYEIPPDELEIAIESIAEEKGEPIKATKERVAERSKQGTLHEEVAEFKKRSPLKFRSALYYLSETNPETYRKIQHIADVKPQDMRKVVEVFDQKVDVSKVFLDEGARISQLQKVALKTSDNNLYALVPENFQLLARGHLELTDSQQKPIADLIINYADTMRTIDGVEERSIESIRLVTHEEETNIKTLANQFITITVHLDAKLKQLSQDTALDLNTQTSIDPQINDQFRKLARAQKLALVDRAGVFTVKRTALSNQDDIKEANIIFKIEKTWNGNNARDRVKIFRYDEETLQTQILPTAFVGEEGRYAIFRGASPRGLSTFAVFMVETIQSAEPAEFKMGIFKRFGLPLFLIVLVGGIFVGTFISKGKDKKKRA